MGEKVANKAVAKAASEVDEGGLRRVRMQVFRPPIWQFLDVN